MTKFQYTVTDTTGKIVFFGEREGAYQVAGAGSLLTVRSVQPDEVDAVRAKIKAAARTANNTWLADMDNDAKYADMLATSGVLDAFEAVHGKEMIQLSEACVAEIMDRSVFGTVDRQRAAAKADQVPAAARVTAADLAIERGITTRIRAGALAELEALVDPSIDMPIYHDAEFLRAEILRIAAGVRADIAAAKAEHLARAA